MAARSARDPAGSANYPEYYKVTLTYDPASNITLVDDARWDAFDLEYTLDGLNRLTVAEPPGGAGSVNTYQAETFRMLRSGAIDLQTFDANDDGDTADGGDTRDERTINAANEITERNLVAQTYPTPEVPEREPVYDGVGNLVHDDTDESTNGFKYEYDVLGRLTRIGARLGGESLRFDSQSYPAIIRSSGAFYRRTGPFVWG